MTQTYEYNGFTLQIAIESDFQTRKGERVSGNPGYVAVVKICEQGTRLSRFSPLRFVEKAGRPFLSESAALDGGFHAARTLVDDLSQYQPRRTFCSISLLAVDPTRKPDAVCCSGK